MGTMHEFLADTLPEPYRILHCIQREQYEKEPHGHDIFQIIIVMDGQLEVTVCGKKEVLPPGSVHVIPPGFEHALSCREYYAQTGVDISCGSDVRGIVPLLSMGFPAPAVFRYPEAVSIAQKVAKKCQIDSPVSRMQAVSLLDTLVLNCVEQFSLRNNERFDRKLSDYLDSHLEEAVTLQQIAEDFFISVPHLERLCQQFFQNGTIALLNQRRIRKACLLLVTTEQSVGEIAHQTGFSDLTYFSSFFRKKTGLSPRDYRKNRKLD